ncbi:MAG: hypothetical protein RL748_1584 [Pseudomonadota bacterium]|jgi:hypothetical protein
MGQYTQAIQKLYVSYFSRPADSAGLAYWEAAVANSKGDLSAISEAFARSAEYRDAFAGKSNAEVIDQVYMNLFGRHAEDSGKAFWTGMLDRHTLSIDHIVEHLANGARGTDLVALSRKVMTAETFTSALTTDSQIKSYDGIFGVSVAKELLLSVVDDATYTQFMAGGLKKTLDTLLQHFIDPGVAVGEPNPNAGVAVGEPNPNAGIAVGEPHPGQGIAIGEPHPAAGFAVGEPHPMAGFAIGEPTPGEAVKLIGVLDMGTELFVQHF